MGLVHADITGEIISAAMEVHTVLGPGLLESAYRVALVHELRQRGLDVQAEVGVPMEYKGVPLGTGFRLDLLVADRVVVELKAVKAFEPIHHAQLLSYLRLTGRRVGLLINFHVPKLKDGIKRVVL